MMICFNMRERAMGRVGGATTLERVHPVKMHNNIIYIYRLGGAQTSCRIGKYLYAHARVYMYKDIGIIHLYRVCDCSSYTII